MSPEVATKIQQQVRAYFNIPPDVSITLGTPSASEFPNYSLVPVTMSRQGKAQKAEFLLSSDGKTLVRFTKIDLTKDIYAETMGKIDIAGRPVRGNPDARSSNWTTELLPLPLLTCVQVPRSPEA